MCVGGVFLVQECDSNGSESEILKFNIKLKSEATENDSATG